jgi:hypothetical protein
VANDTRGYPQEVAPMKWNIRLLAVLAGLASVGFAGSLAAKTWLDFINVGQLTSNTRLRIQCEGSEPYDELKCRITSYYIYKMTDLEDKQTHRARLINVDTASDRELDQLKGRSTAPEEVAHERARMAAATPEQRAAWADRDAIGQAFSGAKTRSELKSALAKSQEMEEDTCGLLASESEATTYRRVTEHRWEFRAGPSHHCHVSQVFTLENKPDNAAAWTHTETVTSADSEGECSVWGDRVNQTDVFTADVPNLITGCKYIRMGQ